MSVDEGWNKVKDVMKQSGYGLGKNEGGVELGALTNYEIASDIKHLGMRLARYKFVAKLMMYEREVSALELGCNEAWGALMMRQNTNLKKWIGLDFDPDAMAWNRKFMPSEFEFVEGDFFQFKASTEDTFNLIYSLDVIEHIEPDTEDDFCRIITRNLRDDGTAVIGTPNIAMSPYASETSRQDHINLYDQRRLFETMKRHFNNVYIFNMNDEIVHTGFAPMACYIFAVCSSPIKGV